MMSHLVLVGRWLALWSVILFIPVAHLGCGAAEAEEDCDPPCREGFECVDGECVPASAVGPPTQGEIGSACTEGANCLTGVCMSSAQFPGGYCSVACGYPHELDARCPVGSACVRLSEASSVCMQLCASPTDCRAGYVCHGNYGSSVCMPQCRSDLDCPLDSFCNTASGICETGARAVYPLGSPCTASEQCRSGVCLTEEFSDGVLPQGYCIAACSAEEAGGFCQGGEGVCIDLTQTEVPGYLCMAACTSGVDCRPEYLCSADAGVSIATGHGMCVPRCQYFPCAAGYVCDESVGICVESQSFAATTEIFHQHVGTFDLGPTEDQFLTITLSIVPENTSFALSILGHDYASYATVLNLTAPNGQTLYDYRDPMVSAWKVTDGFGYFDQFGVLFPNAPRLSIPPGTYSLTLGAYEPGRYDVEFFAQTGAMAPHQTGRLPVAFWFTENDLLNAQTAQTDPRFQEAVAFMEQIFAQAGITLGPIHYLEMDPEAARRFRVVNLDGQDPLDLLAYGTAAEVTGVHFYFVEQILEPTGGGILGMSGGIPGPVPLAGLRHSGVMQLVELFEGDPRFAAKVMAHEAGHYLGLYHTTEQNGQDFDPLEDTPECPASVYDRNGDGIVDAFECLGVGADNLMFWSGDHTMEQWLLTPEQSWVLRRNPLIQTE